MQNDAAIRNREVICKYISDNPGSHLRKIARDLNIQLSTLRYHLDYLERKQSIVCQKQNNLKVYFISGTIKPREKILIPLLQHQRYREIILLLVNSPGLTSSEIADRLSISSSSASKYINILDEQKILFCKKVGRRKKYYINDEKSVVGLLKTYKNFMADMSFEIRTPMNAIMGMTSLLLEEKLTPEQRDFVETIKASGEALIAIVNEILDLSKIEQEKIQLDTQTFDLRNCIEEAQEIVSSKAAKKKIDLVYDVDKSAPTLITGDPNRLRQILVNLLNNALDSSDKGEVLISVSARSSNRSCNLHFAVKDTGTGMTQDKADSLFETYDQVINRLFDSFSQTDFESIIDVDKTILNKGAETSLGLAISKRLVELMKGRIWAKSNAGNGTTIHFTIKTEYADVPPTFSMVQQQLEGKRILITDKSMTNCRVLDQWVREWGMVPSVTDSAKEALGLIQKGASFDAAILDVNVADIDGYSLAREIHNYIKALPIIALANTGQRPKRDFLEYSIQRPLKFSKLREMLISIFEERSVPTKDGPFAKSLTGKSSLRILLAEDNLLNQKVFLTMIRRLGHRVDAVTNGIEALRAIEHEHYDLVLMDIRMPEMNGLEATKIIRQRWHDSLKIVAVTAFALGGDREKFLAAGMDDYISKPIKIGELKALLEKFLPE